MKKKLARYGDGGAMAGFSSAMPVVGTIIGAITAAVKKGKANKEAKEQQQKDWATQSGMALSNNQAYSEAILTDYYEGTGIGQSDYFNKFGGKIKGLRKLAGGGYFLPGAKDGYYGNTGYSGGVWNSYKEHGKPRDAYTGYISDEDYQFSKGDTVNNPFADTSGGLSINKYDGSVEVKPGYHLTSGVPTPKGMRTTTNENRQSWVDVKNDKIAGPVVNTMVKAIDSGTGLPIGTAFEAMIGAVDKAVRKKRGDSRFDSRAEENAAQQQWKNQRDSVQEGNNRYSQMSFDGNNERGGQDGLDFYNAKGGRIKLAMGGNIKTEGGVGVPLDDNSFVMEGNDHEEGGIVLNKNGQDIAEVEDDEVVTEDGEVFSDRIKLPNGKTIADERIRIGEQKNMVNNQLAKVSVMTKDKYKNNGNKRIALNHQANLAKLEQEEKALFNYQQSINGSNAGKMAKGGKIYAMGGNGMWETENQFSPPSTGNEVYVNTADNSDNTFYGGWEAADDDLYTSDEFKAPNNYGTLLTDSTYAPYNYSGESYAPNDKSSTGKGSVDFQKVMRGVGNLAPYADNIYNAFAIENMAKVPVPMRKAYQPLVAKINANRRITAVKDAVSSANKDVDQNTGASNVARIQKMANYYKGLDTQVGILADVEQKEIAMRNANTAGANATANENVAVSNQYDTDVFNHSLYKDSLRSANVANATADFNQQRFDDKYYAMEKEKLGIMSRGYQGSGVYYNAMGTPDFDSMVSSDPEFKSMLWNSVKNKPTERDKYIKYYGKPKGA